MTAPTRAPIGLGLPGAELGPRIGLGGDRVVDHRVELRGVQRLEALGCGDRPGVAAAVGDDVGEHLLGLGGSQFAVDLHAGQRGEVRSGYCRRRTLVGECLLDVHEGSGGIATRVHHGDDVAVLVTVGHDEDGLGVGALSRELGEPETPCGGKDRERRSDPFDPRRVRIDDHEIGLLEVAVVVGVLLAAQRVGAAVVLVPVAGLLADRLTGFEHADLTLRLVLDGTADRTHRVDVLDLAPGAELGARSTHADVGVDAHRALLHLGVRCTDGDENRPEFAHVRLGLLRGADVGAADDLHERHPGPIEVDERVVAAVDPATGTAEMGRLAGVLLEVGTFDSDPEPVGQIEVTVDADRLVVLADLVGLGHVGIEVVLAGERRTLHRAVEGEPQPHGQLDGLPVEHRQGAGQPERHRVDVGVRLVAESVGRAREELRARRELDVDLEADHHLVAVEGPGRLRARPGSRAGAHWGTLRSNSAAVRNMRASWSAGARIWTPTGKPDSPVPNGTLIAGSPVRFDGIV